MGSDRVALHHTVREPRLGGRPRHTLVLSHALGCDLTMWDKLAGLLADDCRVVCHDHRGHGRSPRPDGPYSMAELAGDAARLLAEIGGGPVVWVGLSMGGMLGQELALRHPPGLKALVIANACAAYDAPARALWRQRISSVQTQGMAAVADAALQRWFSAAFRARHPALLARMRQGLLGCDPRAYAAACHAVSLHDTLARLPALTLPTLVIAGGDDQATPVAMSEALAARLPRARLRVLGGAGHLSVLEQPQAFHAALREFLRTLETHHP